VSETNPVTSTIGRSIVDDEDFPGRVGLIGQRLEAGIDEIATIVGDDYH
jgi:hypothetical protein